MKFKRIFFENLALSNNFFINKFKKNYFTFIKNGSYILSDFVENFEKDFKGRGYDTQHY